MPIPLDFRFSQASLRDYLACPRRFCLRYIERLAWPAIEAEPYIEREQHLKRGALFHRLVEQKLKGIPEGALTSLATENNLAEWWNAFLVFHAGLPDGARLPEWTITVRLGQYALIAKYDLLIPGADGKCTIYDWKTSSIRTKPDVLRNDIQTRLYLMMAAETGGSLTGGAAFPPDSLSIGYWFSAFPREPELIPYSEALYKRDRADILELIEKIATAPVESFV
ncbi:MAG: PD-(D/E)XK nuclease family protein, partial [Anaerolineaceae bacterium]